tara:strand:+ start:618 stop:1493 length:876 start_codon:yes stop_codon:yes gene_type:complete
MPNYRQQTLGNLGAVSACASCVSSLVLDSFSTTDPTNAGGTNGTATINFTGDSGPFEYTVNGGSPIACTSPFTITGLVASTNYTVVVTDSTSNSISASFTLGETSFEFDADFIMVTYQFTDGDDLDTRSRIVTPNIGQTTQPTMVGFGVNGQFPGSGTPIITWGGDNTGTGFESALIDMEEFRDQYPNSTSLVADFRCFWWVAVGTNDVIAACTLWKGGTPVKSGYVWTNPTATDTLAINSVGLQIPGPLYNGGTTPRGQDVTGFRLATLTYNLTTNTGVLNNADTTTPNV